MCSVKKIVYIVQHYEWEPSYVSIFNTLDETIEWLVNYTSSIYTTDFDNLTFGEIIEIFNDYNYGLDEYEINIDINEY